MSNLLENKELEKGFEEDLKQLTEDRKRYEEDFYLIDFCSNINPSHSFNPYVEIPYKDTMKFQFSEIRELGKGLSKMLSCLQEPNFRVNKSIKGKSKRYKNLKKIKERDKLRNNIKSSQERFLNE